MHPHVNPPIPQNLLCSYVGNFRYTGDILNPPRGQHRRHKHIGVRPQAKT